MTIRRALPFFLMVMLTACSTIDVSSAHLRSSVPRYTTFTTESPMGMAECISKRWASSGRTALTQQKTEHGYALQTMQKLDLQQKQSMIYVAIDTSREGASVRFYSNHADEIGDRSMVSTIQACH
jgi:hypothetical protein